MFEPKTTPLNVGYRTTSQMFEPRRHPPKRGLERPFRYLNLYYSFVKFLKFLLYVPLILYRTQALLANPSPGSDMLVVVRTKQKAAQNALW